MGASLSSMEASLSSALDSLAANMEASLSSAIDSLAPETTAINPCCCHPACIPVPDACDVVHLAPSIHELDPCSPSMAAHVICSLGEGSYGYVFKVLLRDPKSRAHCINGSSAAALKIFTNISQSIDFAIMKEISISLALSRLATAATPIVRTLHAHSMQETHMCDLGLSAPEPENPSRKGLPLHCMSMELCEGGDLADFLFQLKASRESGLMTNQEAASFLFPVAKALEFCHRNHVLHLDVKPSNVLFKKKGRLETACLGDFSLAMEIPSDKPTLAISTLSDAFLCNPGMGTDQFVAPEVSASGYYSPLADVFSLGCVLLFALTEYRISWGGSFTSWPYYDGHYVDDLLSQFDGNQKCRKWQGLSPDAKRLIIGMLCPDPLRRLNLQQVLSHRWFQENTLSLSDIMF